MIRKFLFDLLPNNPRINFHRSKTKKWSSFPLALSVSLLLAVLFSGCQEQDLEPEADNKAGSELSTDQMVLGDKLENPYTVANMKQAWENIKPELISSGRISGDKVVIAASHYYVKFMPKNEKELDILNNDTTVYFYSYPLDVEIPEGSSNYRDPEVPEGQPTYQYASVPYDYLFPNVEHEILEELFIPEEVTDLNSAQYVEPCERAPLLNEAMSLTRNIDERVPLPIEDPCGGSGGGGGGGGGGGPVGCSYCPQGTMRVWDDRAGRYVPLVGLEVKARRWFTTKSATTDATGKYIIWHDFDRDKNYSLDWDRYEFSVRSGTFGQAGVNGPKTGGWWSVDFGVSGSASVNNEQQYYALIFQAAYDYYYGSRFGLSSPPKNGFWNPQTKIAADITTRQNEKPSHAAMYARTSGLLPSLYIRTYGDRSDRVYAVTTHELAHAAHWEMDRDAFRLLVVGYGVFGLENREAVVESWAMGVEWQFAQQRYAGVFGIAGYMYENNVLILGIQNGNYQAEYSNHPTRGVWRSDYTPVVVDLIDNFNQRAVRGASYPLDRVAGYTILEVEKGLRGATTWYEWRDQIIARNSNSTSGNVNELFSNWH